MRQQIDLQNFKKPINVDVDEKIFEVVDRQSVKVGVGLVHLHGVHVLVGRNVFRQLKEKTIFKIGFTLFYQSNK